MEGPWEDFPVEFLEIVLLRVPWHDLCRCRAVCKKWNSAITEPRFVRLHATTSRPESCVLTAPRIRLVPPEGRWLESIFVPAFTENHPWQFLDIVTNRFYSIPDTFIQRYLLRGRRETEFVRHTLASSGGLILAVYVGDNMRHVVVCNPVSKWFHQIRGFLSVHDDIVAMVVETGTQRYRILRFCSAFMDKSPEVHLYDSRVEIWRKLCNTPGFAYRPRSSVVLDGTFYTMFEDTVQRRNELYSCDLESGGWRLIDVPLPRPPLHAKASKSPSQVVAASGRLFFMEYSGPAAKAVVTVTIWEIALGEGRVSRVCQLPRFLTHTGSIREFSTTIPAVTIGCGDSIVVSTLAGYRVRWDLRATWHHLPPFLRMIPNATCHSFFVAPIDLRMQPAPP